MFDPLSPVNCPSVHSVSDLTGSTNLLLFSEGVIFSFTLHLILILGGGGAPLFSLGRGRDQDPQHTISIENVYIL